MPSRSDLEAMSSHELHDLAMRRALHHADFGFLWQLLRELPAAEAAEGNPGRTGADLYRISALISDALGSGEGETAEALRPLYLDYLEKHGDDVPPPAASDTPPAPPAPPATN
ncbi:MAG TPA: hypothetical protein VIH64_00210 [Streptosporangiaceae bacterium]